MSENCISGEGAGVAFCWSGFVKELLMAIVSFGRFDISWGFFCSSFLSFFLSFCHVIYSY
jgi:hypothetical protein